MEEDFVSFECAKFLKEKGFDEPYQYFYKLNSNKIYRGTVFTNTQIGDKFYNAPTLWVACKWLREVHNCIIIIDYSPTYNKYAFDFYHNGKANTRIVSYSYNSYEEAVEAGLLYALKNLI